MQSKPNKRSNFFINSNSWSIFLYEKWFGKQFEIAGQTAVPGEDIWLLLVSFLFGSVIFYSFWKNSRDGILKMMESKSGVY